jgi:hypothetical protein
LINDGLAQEAKALQGQPFRAPITDPDHRPHTNEPQDSAANAPNFDSLLIIARNYTGICC